MVTTNAKNNTREFVVPISSERVIIWVISCPAALKYYEVILHEPNLLLAEIILSIAGAVRFDRSIILT